MNILPKKRNAEELADPDKYLELYFEERGIGADLTSDVTRAIDKRADQARERFKRLRQETASNPPNDEGPQLLTPAQKYARRLVNNRKSSAASRVYREVLKVERAYALSELSKRAKHYETQVSTLTGKLQRLERCVTALRSRNLQLETELATLRGRFSKSEARSTTTNETRPSAPCAEKPISGERPPPFTVPLTPKTAEQVISTALKLSSATNTEGELTEIGLPQASPDSRRNEALFCF